MTTRVKHFGECDLILNLGIIVFVTSYKMTTKLIRDFNLTRERIFIWIFSAVCYVYEKVSLRYYYYLYLEFSNMESNFRFACSF